MFLPGESQGRRSLVGCRLWGRTVGHDWATEQQQLLFCSSQARERGPQQVWPTGLVAPWHVGSSRIRGQICVSHTGRQILNHWTTREVLIRFANQPDQCYRGLYRKWLTLVIRLSVVGVRPCMDAGFNEYWGSLERGLTTYVRNFTGSALFAFPKSGLEIAHRFGVLAWEIPMELRSLVDYSPWCHKTRTQLSD